MTLSKKFAAVIFSMILIVAPVAAVSAKDGEITPPRNYSRPEFKSSAELQKLLEAAVTDAVARHKGDPVKAGEIAATLIDLRDPASFRIADVDGGRRIYP